MDQSYVIHRKRMWRMLGIRCLRGGNVKGFHTAYKVAKSIRREKE